MHTQLLRGRSLDSVSLIRFKCFQIVSAIFSYFQLFSDKGDKKINYFK
jgi:hypothetical protein